MELLGFSAKGLEVLPESHVQVVEKGADPTAPQGSTPRKQQLSWEEISSKSAKIVSFADLAGHERCVGETEQTPWECSLFGFAQVPQNHTLRIDRNVPGLCAAHCWRKRWTHRHVQSMATGVVLL